MKNLIEEIERVIQALKAERQKCFEEIDYPLSQVDKLEARILAYEDVLNVFKYYNIFAAPKSIKLSEIVSKLEEFYVDEYIIHRENNTIYIHEKEESYLVDSIVEIFNNKIAEIQLDYLYDETKWLYALWIAETEIIDDLKEIKE